ncbi:nucleophosmin 1b isoform X2 [Amia ocellicauda]|uniref:nucleophosmin 1b isoform X2 n=1 Tax=Amia ocellicauda TaxID=2972642 RepID=UPI003463D390
MAEDNDTEFSRPQIFLFGCELKNDKKEYKLDIEDDEDEHQLSLKAVCLGADAEDKTHEVEIEGMTYDGKMTKVHLAVLRPSVLPTVCLGGFEITPPVTFRLKSGSGPVFISGQHFVSSKESDDEDADEEEHNTSPVKRPSSSMPGSSPVVKKLKLEKQETEEEEEEEEEDDADEDDDDEDDEEEEEEDSSKKTPQKSSAVKTPQKKVKATLEKNQSATKSASKQNGSPGKAGTPAVKPQAKVIKELWNFAQTLKVEKK